MSTMQSKSLRALRRLALDDPSRFSKLQEFQRARAKSRKVIKDAKKDTWTEFTADISESTSSSKLWRKVKAVSGKSRHVQKVIMVEGNFTNDAGKVADQFAKVSANSNFSDTFLRAKSIAEAEFSYSDESRRSPELDLY